jgi:hypothetical protein
MNVFVDIETIPAGEKPQLSELKHPAQMTKTETIEKWYADTEAREADLDKIYRKRALDYAQGQILCIAWAIDNGEIHGLVYPHLNDYLSGNDEKELMHAFEEELIADPAMGQRLLQGTNPTWVAFNGRAFDYPYLFLRACKYGCKTLMGALMPPNDRDFLVDVMKKFCHTDYKGMISMDEACKFFGIPSSKGKIDGSMIYDEFMAGNHVDILTYCKEDVRCLRDLYNKLT